MTRAHIVAAAPLTECACRSGRVRLLQLALDVDRHRWRELLAAELRSLDVQLHTAAMEWVEQHDISVLVVELRVEHGAVRSELIEAVVWRVIERMRTAAATTAENVLHSKNVLMSTMERDVADLSRYVDAVMASLLDHGSTAVPKTMVAEAESMTPAEIGQGIARLLAPANVRWDYVVTP
ncbi:hypothetical protein [Nocardia sp. NPDC050175]|uniref:hypothetical protein n=1 Tax=Nocardia sp. NPDC050175 TaxID=3364317 RepID=UPI0037983DD1